jgi:pyridoxal 5'-phosphate synthase pdxS subunit
MVTGMRDPSHSHAPNMTARMGLLAVASKVLNNRPELRQNGEEMPFDLDMTKLRYGTELVKRGFAKMQQGGVVMDVTNAEQAVIAEEAGAVAVMALERVPADIRAQGGVARMADPVKIQEIMDSVTIPVMAKCRIGHFVEAQVLEGMGVDMIDESEVLTPADPFYHVNKKNFTIPFVCGARDLGEALRRIDEGAAMIRTKGEAGTGNIVEAVRHQRVILGKVRSLKGMDEEELWTVAREIEAPIYLVKEVAGLQRLPVIKFAAGGVATPADAAMMMQMGSDGVFVGSGIFKSEDPSPRAKAIVEAVTHFDDPLVIAEVSKNLGDAMPGIEIETINPESRMQERGW